MAVVRYLLDHGADKDVKNNNGEQAAQLTNMEEIRNILGCKSKPEVIKLFSFSTQLSRKFILLINIKITLNFYHFFSAEQSCASCWHFNIY